MSLLGRRTGPGRLSGISYARKLSRPAGEGRASRPLGCECVLLSVRVYVCAAFYEAHGASACIRKQHLPGRHQSPPCTLIIRQEGVKSNLYFGTGEMTILRCGSSPSL